MNQLTLISFLLILHCQVVLSGYWQAMPEQPVKLTDMSMMDVKFPVFTDVTYYAYSQHWVGSGLDGNKDHYSYYAGTAYNTNEVKDRNPALNTSLQWSAWPPTNQRLITPLAAYPTSILSPVVAEGASATVQGKYLIHPDRWYRHVMRFWRPLDPEKAKTASYYGWWMKDLADPKGWMLVALVEVPIADARYFTSGLGGFIERFGKELPGKPLQRQSWKNLYTHKDGQWLSANQLSMDVPAVQFLSEGAEPGSATTFVYPYDPNFFLRKTTCKLSLDQAPTPKLNRFEIAKLRAELFDSQLLVSWAVGSDSPPVMHTRIKLLNASEQLIGERHTDLPSVSQLLIQMSEKEAGELDHIKLVATDIFNRTQSIRIDPKQPQPNSEDAHSTLKNPRPGVKIAYFGLPDATPAQDPKTQIANWSSMPDIDSLPLVQTAFQHTPLLSNLPRSYGLATRVTSYLRIPKTGIYRFHFTACDGGSFSINGKKVIIQDTHRSGNAKSTTLFLQKGDHSVRLEGYFDVAHASNFLKPRLKLEYEGPGIIRQEIPQNAWNLPSKQFPQTNLKAQFVSSKKQPNLVEVRIDPLAVDKDISEPIEKVEIADARGFTWLVAKPDDFDKKQELLLPEGRHQLFARVYLQDNVVIDLPPKAIETKNPASAPWSLANPGATTRPFAIAATPTELTLMGDGNRWATQSITGDFTFTMQIDELANALPTAKTSGNESRVTLGFLAAHSLKPPPHNQSFRWYFSPYYKGRFDTPQRNDHGLNQKNWQNSFHEVPVPGQFRFIRRGAQFSAQLRPDAQAPWTTLFEETYQAPKTMTIGPYLFFSPDGDTNALWKVKLSNISIETTGADTSK